MEERKSRYEQFLEEEEAPKTKRCSKCKQVKALGEFHNHRRSRDGHKAACKQCSNRGSKYKDRADMFWKLYTVRTIRVGECVEWTGSYKTKKSGVVKPVYWWGERPHRRLLPVRQLVYRLAIGDIPDGMFVVTSCRNARCVRHSHLNLVTDSEREALFRNSSPTGDKHGMRKKAARCPSLTISARNNHGGCKVQCLRKNLARSPTVTPFLV